MYVYNKRRQKKEKRDIFLRWIICQPPDMRKSAFFSFLEALMDHEAPHHIGYYLRAALNSQTPFVWEVFQAATTDELGSLLSSYISRSELTNDDFTASDQITTFSNIMYQIQPYGSVTVTRLQAVFENCVMKLEYPVRPLCLWFFLVFQSTASREYLDSLMTVFRDEGYIEDPFRPVIRQIIYFLYERYKEDRRHHSIYFTWLYFATQHNVHTIALQNHMVQELGMGFRSWCEEQRTDGPKKSKNYKKHKKEKPMPVFGRLSRVGRSIL